MNETEVRSGELLRLAADSVDVTHSWETSAASEYHELRRYLHDLATDAATIDAYNTSAHLVCLSASYTNHSLLFHCLLYVYDLQWRSRTFGRPGRWSNLPPFRLRFLKLESLDRPQHEIGA